MVNKKMAHLFWKLFDPIIIIIGSRLYHLESNNPLKFYHSKGNQIATYSNSVVIFKDTIFQNYGEIARIVLGDYTHVRG